jgi:hypothetical protein
MEDSRSAHKKICRSRPVLLMIMILRVNAVVVGRETLTGGETRIAIVLYYSGIATSLFN